MGEKLYLGLYLCRRPDSNKVLEPFNIPFTLEALDKDGNIHSWKATSAILERHREICCIIPPGEACAEGACGSQTFLTMPTLQNYIVNDTIFFRCKLTLP